MPQAPFDLYPHMTSHFNSPSHALHWMTRAGQVRRVKPAKGKLAPIVYLAPYPGDRMGENGFRSSYWESIHELQNDGTSIVFKD